MHQLESFEMLVDLPRGRVGVARVSIDTEVLEDISPTVLRARDGLKSFALGAVTIQVYEGIQHTLPGLGLELRQITRSPRPTDTAARCPHGTIGGPSVCTACLRESAPESAPSTSEQAQPRQLTPEETVALVRKLLEGERTETREPPTGSQVWLILMASEPRERLDPEALATLTPEERLALADWVLTHGTRETDGAPACLARVVHDPAASPADDMLSDSDAEASTDDTSGAPS